MAGQVKPIPVPVILAAANGDENALAAVVAHYQKYIRALATRPVKDEYGNEYLYVDEDMRLRLETKLIHMFISLVRKYTRARKLTPRMLNELIEKIEVFNAEKVDGVWEQRLRIHYNCVGAIEIPDLIPLPAPEVSVNTRKGVVVNYAPSTIAG